MGFSTVVGGCDGSLLPLWKCRMSKKMMVSYRLRQQFPCFWLAGCGRITLSEALCYAGTDMPPDLHGEGNHLSEGFSMMRDLSVTKDKGGASGISRRPHEGDSRQWFVREI